MTGLSAAELPSETLYAGDVLKYYSMAFVCGHRVATILSVDDTPGAPYPISVDTGEMIPLVNMVKRHADRFGNRLKGGYAKWRKLRTYRLSAGRFQAPTRCSTLNSVLSRAVEAAVAETRRQLSAEREERGCSDLETASTRPGEDTAIGPTASRSSSARELAQEKLMTSAVASFEVDATPPSEKKFAIPATTSPNATIDLISSDSEPDEDQGLFAARAPEGEHAEGHCGEEVRVTEDACVEVPSNGDLLKLQEYLKSIPTRGQREKIRHQPRKRRCGWHVNRSRKRRHQAKCGLTRSGTQIHHAKSLTAKKTKDLLFLPTVKERLQKLRARRPVYKEAIVEHPHSIQEVAWPEEIEYIEECVVPDGTSISFPDIGDFGECSCFGDCFMDTCENVGCAVYCTAACCKLGAVCSDAPRARSTLKLFNTGRVGLGVYTTTFLDVGDIIGEYAGKLCEYSALNPGQPNQAKKQNSGYTMLYNTKSVRNKFVHSIVASRRALLATPVTPTLLSWRCTTERV